MRTAGRAGRKSAAGHRCHGAGRVYPRIGHVFILMLENEGYEATFGAASPAKYLNQLARQGALVRNYFGTSHFSLGNYITLISGHAPNPATENDCEQFAEFAASGVAADGQVIGSGCVYPASVATIANQLQAKGLTWKAYMQDMGNNPARASASCGHPSVGAIDKTQAAQMRDQYATRQRAGVLLSAASRDFIDMVEEIGGILVDAERAGA
jgi:hypothetical protein